MYFIIPCFSPLLQHSSSLTRDSFSPPPRALSTIICIPKDRKLDMDMTRFCRLWFGFNQAWHGGSEVCRLYYLTWSLLSLSSSDSFPLPEVKFLLPLKAMWEMLMSRYSFIFKDRIRYTWVSPETVDITKSAVWFYSRQLIE